MSLVPVGLWILTGLLPVPFLDMNALQLYGGPFAGNLLEASVGALVGAFVLVEIAAAIVPPWRSLRGSASGRRWLSMATLALAFALVTVNIRALAPSLAGAGILLGSTWLVTLSVLAFMALAWALLGAADRQGLGSSLAVFVGLSSAREALRVEIGTLGAGALAEGVATPATPLLLLALSAAATLFVLRASTRGPAPGGAIEMRVRAPVTGLVPFWAGASLTGAVMMLAPVGGGLPGAARIGWLIPCAAAAAVLPWLFHRPAAVARMWARLFEQGEGAATRGSEEAAAGEAEKGQGESAPREQTADAAYAPPGASHALAVSEEEADPSSPRIPAARLAMWTQRARSLVPRAMVPAVAYLAIVAWPAWPVLGADPAPLGRISAVAGTCLLVAALHDIVVEARFRRAHPGAAAVRVEVSLPAAEAALAALEVEGIPACARNAGVRSLLWFFGPFAALEILVPPASTSRAKERLSGRWSPA